MIFFTSNDILAAPASQWLEAEVVPLRIALPLRAVAQLEWLSERWSLTAATIAADVLVAVTSGRYLLAQLEVRRLQPQQATQGLESAALNLQLLKPTVDLLERAMVPNATDLSHKCGQMIMTHLLGVLNPQAVSVALPDPDGEKLRVDDASLTVHLPEELEEKVDTLARTRELTKSDVIRNCLLLHMYGRLRYELWTSEGSWRPKRKSMKDVEEAYKSGNARFSRPRLHTSDEPPIKTSSSSVSSPRRSEFIRQHGKSGEGTRVHMPALLKQRLEESANAQGMKAVSEYCRRTLAVLI
jgi:Arc/MetJ-type ribon-helix-helix transcriptional regulator